MTKKICFLLFVLLSMQGYAQTGIGTTTPNTSARFEVASTDKGFLLPRMTAAQRGVILTPANGLLVYQTDSPTGFYVNTGTPSSPVWTRVNMDWTRAGNDVSYSDGNVGIGTNNPTARLNLVGGGVKLANGFNNSTNRPSLNTSSIGNYEIRGVGSISGNAQNDLADDGFLRLSAGGGTSVSSQSSIDISGFSTVADMSNNIVMRTAGAERLRIDNSGNVNINGSLSIGNPTGNVVTKAAGFVNAGTFVTLGNLRATVTTSGPRGLSLATVTGTLNLFFQGVYTNSASNAITDFTSTATAFTTTPSGSLFGWSFGSPGNTIIYHLTDATNNNFYRVTLIIMHDYIKNFISIERLL